LRTRFHVSDNPLDSRRPGIPPVPQVEDKSWISNNISAKTGGCRVITAQEFFYFSKQIHRLFSL